MSCCTPCPSHRTNLNSNKLYGGIIPSISPILLAIKLNSSNSKVGYPVHWSRRTFLARSLIAISLIVVIKSHNK